MTADVVLMHPEEKRLEARRIADRRPDVVLQPGVLASKQLAQVERQQVLGGLVKLVAEGWVDLEDTDLLPMVVDTLLRNAPQSTIDPATVAKSLQEAADAWGAQDCDERSGETAFIVTQLAAGTARTSTYEYEMGPVRLLVDWLSTAGAR